MFTKKYRAIPLDESLVADGWSYDLPESVTDECPSNNYDKYLSIRKLTYEEKIQVLLEI